MTTVHHIQRIGTGGSGGRTLYVGRPSDYGNPFKIGEHGTRDEVIAKFKAWWLLPEQESLRKRAVIECRDRVLLCHCWPSDCHADVIAAYVNGYWDSLSALAPGKEDPPL